MGNSIERFDLVDELSSSELVSRSNGELCYYRDIADELDRLTQALGVAEAERDKCQPEISTVIPLCTCYRFDGSPHDAFCPNNAERLGRWGAAMQAKAADLQKEREDLVARNRIGGEFQELCERRTAENVELKQQLTALQAIVDRLPKIWRLDESGKLVQDFPATPGLTVYRLRRKGCGCVAVEELKGGNTVENDGIIRRFGHESGWLIHAEDCYSTREAAQASADASARKDGG